MKNWKGIWIIAIAIVHSVFAILNYGVEYKNLIAGGVINSVNSLESSVASWFFLFGILILAVGFLVYSLEQRSIPVPKSAALSLLVLTVLGAALMPVSGFWLMFPPVLAMLLSRNHV